MIRKNLSQYPRPSSVAKSTYVKRSRVWRIYRQRADSKCHRYEPDPEVKTLEEFLRSVDEGG
ncbi:MAG: DUF3024 domain-containing protein [Deltaproteobacteria bacterium]|nr:DUF3024 domain-containing protein [Deltaproteobacteria bacterium]MBW2390245.1 DUF3024 domain-containing protein [Deltaproteobacteria bacterium]